MSSYLFKYFYDLIFFLFRCDLCSLSGEDLRRNENMRKKLRSLLDEGKQLGNFTAIGCHKNNCFVEDVKVMVKEL